MREPSFPDLVKYYRDRTAREVSVNAPYADTPPIDANTPSEVKINRETRRWEKALLRKAGKKRRG